MHWLAASLLAAATAAGSTGGPPPLDEAIAALPRSPEAALALVRKRIAYRPYAGLVKGPRGAWWDGTANAADAADLLLEVLRRKGIGGRLAFGRLADGDLTHLLEKVFTKAKPPAEVQAKLPGEKRADPVHDPAVRAIAARHVWVQVRRGDGWIDLDPFAFGAGANTTVAKLERTARRPLPGERRRLRIQVFATMAGGRPRRVLRAEEVVGELVGRRVVFVNHGVDAKARDRKPSADRLRPALLLGRRLVRGAPYVPPFLAPRREPIGRIGDALDRVDRDKKPAALESVLMEVSLVAGGLPERAERRYLYLAGREGLDRLGDLTFLCVVFGGPPDRLVRQWAEETMTLAKKTKGLALPSTGALTPEQARQAAALVNQAYAVAGTTALWMAACSRRLLAGLDGAFGTLSECADARVLGVSLNPRRRALSTDLMFDSVRTWARPGSKASAAGAMAVTRGILEADLEGAIVEALRDKTQARSRPALTVRGVFQAAEAAGVKAVAIARERKAALAKMPLSARARRIVTERIEAGRVVLLPERPVEIAGRRVTAWYEIDRATGQWSGVLDDGRHQAIVEYHETRDTAVFIAGIGMAFVSGFSGSMWTYSAAALKHIGTPNMSWPQVRGEALAAAAQFDHKGLLLQAIGDIIGSFSSPEDMLRNVMAGQAAFLTGHAAGVAFLTRAAP